MQGLDHYWEHQTYVSSLSKALSNQHHFHIVDMCHRPADTSISVQESSETL